VGLIMRSRAVRLSELNARIVDPPAVTPDSPPSMIVCFAHGYGAPGTDLVPLAAELVALAPALSRCRFVFPEAPLVPEELGPWGGRAWWPIDLAALQDALARGAQRVLADTEPDGMGSARRKLAAALEVALREAGLGWDRLALGGFSQGAMLALDLALRADEPPAAVVAFSPTLLCEAVWRRHATRRAGLPVLVSHGRQDPLLPFAQSEALVRLLAEQGLAVDFVPFDGPHTIAMEGLERAARHLVDRLPAPVTSSGT